MRLIVIDSETKLPVPSPEAFLIPDLRDLWRRRIPIDGDRDGNKKIRNLQEFGYVYFQGVWDSRFKLYDSEERVEKIREILKLPKEWFPDELVRNCVSVFRETQVTASLELVDSMNGANADLAKWIKAKRLAIKQGTASPRDVAEILNIIERAPKVIEDVQKAYEVLKREQDALTTGRKGRKLNYFEIPKV